MVSKCEEEETNLLEQMFFPDQASSNNSAQKNQGAQAETSAFDPSADSSQSDSSESSSEESSSSDESSGQSDCKDEAKDGEEACLCSACGKAIVLEKYEHHVSYFCSKQQAQCPYCLKKKRMGRIDSHMVQCQLKVSSDPDIVTCKYCKQRMRKSELKDHAIAHLIEQKQVENQVVQRVAEINEFFEEEKLDVAKKAAPTMQKKDLKELPLSKYTKKAKSSASASQCAICQMDFEEAEQLRTLRCLHIFHKQCIDRWLTTVNGSCVICKVIQSKPERPQSPVQQALHTTDQLMRAQRPNQH